MDVFSRFMSIWPALAFVTISSALTYPDCTNGPLRNNTVCNSNASPSARSAALVDALTMEEKLSNLVDHSLGAERLGLPAYQWWSEALHGVAYSPGVRFADSGDFSSATSFPNPITLSAAFDDELVEDVARVIGAEARAFANAGRAGLDFWTPNINPYKDPRWGRGLETPGEDPLRISNYVKHLIRGLEGTGEYRQVIATCKHYAAYDLERWNGVVRYSFDAIVSTQDLVEYYLPPFRQCVDSNVGSIMCSYNRVNGTPACANSYLMQTILRDHWGWKNESQYIVSDCNAVHNIYADHHWVKTAAQAAGAAFNAGTDNVCEAGGWTTDVIGAYNQSLVSKAVIDQALKRQYEGIIRAGYFNTNATDPHRWLAWEDVNTKNADALAKESAEDGIALLKNDGTLPLQLTNQSVAVVGFWANNTNYVLGNYNGRPPFVRTPLDAAQRLGWKVNYANGPLEGDLTSTLESNILRAANLSDVILYFGGISTKIESEDRDRTSITWPADQLRVLNSLAATGKPLVVVQLGTQVDDTPLIHNKGVNAILWTGYPGQYGGTAALSIITGEKAPAGRLPITQYPGNYTSQVPLTDMSLRPSSNNPGRTYKWYNKAVLPFGYGLHYTNFTATFSDASEPRGNVTRVLDAKELLAKCGNNTRLDTCASISIPISVKNTGHRSSDYVALLFFSSKAGPAPHPIKQLVAYRRLREIGAGEDKDVELKFNWGQLARVESNGDMKLYDGEYCAEIDVSNGKRWCFEVRGSNGTVFDKWPQPPVNGTAGGVNGTTGTRWKV